MSFLFSLLLCLNHSRQRLLDKQRSDLLERAKAVNASWMTRLTDLPAPQEAVNLDSSNVDAICRLSKTWTDLSFSEGFPKGEIPDANKKALELAKKVGACPPPLLQLRRSGRKLETGCIILPREAWRVSPFLFFHESAFHVSIDISRGEKRDKTWREREGGMRWERNQAACAPQHGRLERREVTDPQAIDMDPDNGLGHIAACVSMGRLALHSDNRTKVRHPFPPLSSLLSFPFRVPPLSNPPWQVGKSPCSPLLCFLKRICSPSR